ncbi:hypothetical protein NM688_g2453 [Phlebia brevispora]|uniref:Uncharacterized protein n=1 Tax=Phlebia brevispora TaxID=194682 RepID=A0ACC1T8J1_9APHY|nr:hypothetical protein NM688_g2453 [Phlebia brevispora]
MRFSTLSTLAIATTVVMASPTTVHKRSPISLPFAKVINATGVLNIVAHDLARYKALRSPAKSATSQDSVISAPADDIGMSYIASVGVGTPPTFCKPAIGRSSTVPDNNVNLTTDSLIIDTGSSNTWIGADPLHAYISTSSSVPLVEPIVVDYGSGEFVGLAFSDTITIGSLVILEQTIGVALLAFGFTDVDGILGIGPVNRTMETLVLDPEAEIPTVVDNAFTQALIPEDVVAVSFEPATSNPDMNGELTFGGTDPSKYTGSITYTPVTSISPSSSFWGIEQTITYGSEIILNQTAGIVDTGTTLLGLASDAYSAYQSATGASLDSSTDLLTITSEQYANLQNLTFTIGDTEFVMTPNAQIWPRSLNTVIGGTPGVVYLVVINLGTPSGEGLDFINGQVFLERFYSVYDTTNKRVGLANTPFTFATSN